MAYKLKRSESLIEQLELDSGKVLDVKINVGKLSMSFNAEMNKVLEVEALQPTPENLEKIGVALLNFYSYVLGEENTKELLNYYDDNYIEMISMVTPFIKEVVSPKIKEYLKGKQEKAQMYKKGNASAY